MDKPTECPECHSPTYNDPLDILFIQTEPARIRYECGCVVDFHDVPPVGVEVVALCPKSQSARLEKVIQNYESGQSIFRRASVEVFLAEIYALRAQLRATLAPETELQTELTAWERASDEDMARWGKNVSGSDNATDDAAPPFADYPLETLCANCGYTLGMHNKLDRSCFGRAATKFARAVPDAGGVLSAEEVESLKYFINDPDWDVSQRGEVWELLPKLLSAAQRAAPLPQALLPAEAIAKLRAFREEWWKFMDEDTAYSDAEAGEELAADILPRLSDFINTLSAAPLQGAVRAVVDAAKVVVNEDRDSYYISDGTYHVEPVMFQDLIAAVDALPRQEQDKAA